MKFNGVLCGRATWKDGIPIYAEKGGKAFEAWLKDEGVKNISNVNNALEGCHTVVQHLRGAGSGGFAVTRVERTFGHTSKPL